MSLDVKSFAPIQLKPSHPFVACLVLSCIVTGQHSYGVKRSGLGQLSLTFNYSFGSAVLVDRVLQSELGLITL